MFTKMKMKKEIKKIVNICDEVSDSNILDYYNIKIYNLKRYTKAKGKFTDLLFIKKNIFTKEELLTEFCYNVTIKILPMEFLSGTKNCFSNFNSCFFNTYNHINDLVFDNYKFSEYNKENILLLIEGLKNKFKTSYNEDYFNIENSIDIYKMLTLKLIMGIILLRYKDYHTWYIQTSALFDLFKSKKNIYFKLKKEYKFIEDNKPVEENFKIFLYYFNKRKNILLDYYSIDPSFVPNYKVNNLDKDTVIVYLYD